MIIQIQDDINVDEAKKGRDNVVASDDGEWRVSSHSNNTRRVAEMLKRRRTNLRRCETSTVGAAEIHDEEHEIYVDRTTQVVDLTIESEATQYAGTVEIGASLQVGEMSVVMIRSQLA